MVSAAPRYLGDRTLSTTKRTHRPTQLDTRRRPPPVWGPAAAFSAVSTGVAAYALHCTSDGDGRRRNSASACYARPVSDPTEGASADYGCYHGAARLKLA